MDIKALASKLGMLGEKPVILDIQTVLSRTSEGYLLYRLEDNNKVIKSSLYNSIKPYDNLKLAIVESGNLFGLIRYNTDEIIKPIYKDISIYDELIVLSDKSIVGLLDKNLNQLVPMIYRNVVCIYKTDDGLYYATLTGREVNQLANYVINKGKAYRTKSTIRPRRDLCTNDCISGWELETEKAAYFNIRKNTLEFVSDFIVQPDGTVFARDFDNIKHNIGKQATKLK